MFFNENSKISSLNISDFFCVICLVPLWTERCSNWTPMWARTWEHSSLSLAWCLAHQQAKVRSQVLGIPWIFKIAIRIYFIFTWITRFWHYSYYIWTSARTTANSFALVWQTTANLIWNEKVCCFVKSWVIYINKFRPITIKPILVYLDTECALSFLVEPSKKAVNFLNIFKLIKLCLSIFALY